VVQPIVGCFSPKKHLGHPHGFFEEFHPQKTLSRLQIHSIPTFHFVFNSYYENGRQRVIFVRSRQPFPPQDFGLPKFMSTGPIVTQNMKLFLDQGITREDLRKLSKRHPSPKNQHQELLLRI